MTRSKYELDDPVRAAQFETLVESAAPLPERCRCECNWCRYGERIPKLGHGEGDR